MRKVSMMLNLTGCALSALMNSVSYAGELLKRNDFYLVAETSHEQIKHADERTGILDITGALLSSPCTLMTNEIELPLPTLARGGKLIHPVPVMLAGCAEGDNYIHGAAMSDRSSVIVDYSGQLSGGEHGEKHPEKHTLRGKRTRLLGGTSQLIWYLTEVQQSELQGETIAPPKRQVSNAVLRLRIDYE